MDVEARDLVHHLLRGDIDRHAVRRPGQQIGKPRQPVFEHKHRIRHRTGDEENRTFRTTLPSATKELWRPARSRSRDRAISGNTRIIGAFDPESATMNYSPSASRHSAAIATSALRHLGRHP